MIDHWQNVLNRSIESCISHEATYHDWASLMVEPWDAYFDPENIHKIGLRMKSSSPQLPENPRWYLTKTGQGYEGRTYLNEHKPAGMGVLLDINVALGQCEYRVYATLLAKGSESNVLGICASSKRIEPILAFNMHTTSVPINTIWNLNRSDLPTEFHDCIQPQDVIGNVFATLGWSIAEEILEYGLRSVTENPDGLEWVMKHLWKLKAEALLAFNKQQPIQIDLLRRSHSRSE